MKIISLVVVAVAMSMASSALMAATVPKVAGKYGISISTQCTVNIITTKDGQGDLIGLNSKGGGLGDGVGLMTFATTAASSGHVAISYSEDSLPSVIINGASNVVTPGIKTVSAHFKLTASQFTITPTTGEGPTGPMSFGALDGNGVAGTLYLHWKDFDSDGGTWCSHMLTATKQ
jgi:hypothetical protein